MTSTKLVVARKSLELFSGDLLVHCLGVDVKGKVDPGNSEGAGELRKAIKLGDFKGDCGECLLVYPHRSGKQKGGAKRLLFIAIGKDHERNSDALREVCRKLGGEISAKARACHSSKIGIILPLVDPLDVAEVAEAMVEGVLLGDYRFDKYKNKTKKTKEKAFCGIQKISIFSSVSAKKLHLALDKALRTANAACTARDMANEPGNGWTPSCFACYGETLADEFQMKCRVLYKSDMKRLKMGGLLAVNQGSSEPPKLVIVEYKSEKKNADTILLVGKGLTFDSGGVSLKPASGMQDMKYDMCGGAAVLSTMAIVGAEKPDVNVVAIIPATDNMSGASALKPGDIIRHFGGVTSEIINTDAEGRLILADALAYGIKIYKPTCVVDLATLTGAVIMGLGHHRTGLLGNNQAVIDRVLAAGEKCGEPLWQLPLDKEYSKQIDSDVADIKNSGGKPAGTITAAAYLQKFVGDTPWTHLDIAGTAWDFSKKSYIPKGPSGTGVRTLAEFIRNWKKFSG